MTADPARMTLDTLLDEAELTAKRVVVVEGISDARFLKAWSRDAHLHSRLLVLPIEQLNVPDDLLQSLRLPHGSNRSRVIAFAHMAESEAETIRCIADLDCGDAREDHKYTTLLWTDFPALESYTLLHEVFDRANLQTFEEVLPDALKLFPDLCHALREIFAVRSEHPSLQRPNFKKLVGSSRFIDIRVDTLVPQHHKAKVKDYARSNSADPRAYAYGHDIAGLLFARYRTELKQKAKLTNEEAIEKALLAALQTVGSYRQEGLFVELESWVVST